MRDGGFGEVTPELEALGGGLNIVSRVIVLLDGVYGIYLGLKNMRRVLLKVYSE